MPRNLVTKALFVALGGVALAALAALIAPGSAAAGRLLGSSAILGLACLALLPMTRRWEQGSWTLLGRAGALVVPAAAAIAIASIWWETLFGNSWIGLRLAWLAMLLVAWLAVASLPLRFFNAERIRAAARVAVSTISAAFAWWILVLFEAVPGNEDGARGWVLLLAAPVFGALALPIPPSVARSAWRPLRWVGTAAAIGVVGLLLATLPWNWTPDDRFGHWTLSAVLASTAVTVAVGIALESAKGPAWRRWVHRATVGTLVLEGALLTFSVHDDRPVGEEIVTMLVSLGILTLVGLTTSVVLDAAGRAAERARGAVATLSDVRLSCPRCGRSQVLPLGAATACGRCGLVIEVKVRQDQCLACGYARTGLSSSTACPECGAAGADGVSADPI